MPCPGRPIRGAPAPRPIAAGRPRTTRSSRSSGSRTAPIPPAPASRVVAAGSWPGAARIRAPRRPVRRTYLYREGRRKRRGRSSRHRDPRRTGSAPDHRLNRREGSNARSRRVPGPAGRPCGSTTGRPPDAGPRRTGPARRACPTPRASLRNCHPPIPGQPGRRPGTLEPTIEEQPGLNRRPDRQRRTDGARRGRTDSPASSCPWSIP